MTKLMHFILIIVLIAVSIWSIYTKNWNILVTNICVISGVLIDDRATKMLRYEKVNIKLVRILQKLVPILYTIGAISLLIFGLTKFYWTYQ